jgi:hypothetical protein
MNIDHHEPLNAKKVYNSLGWRVILNSSARTKGSKIVELLPGLSTTVQLALWAAGVNGKIWLLECQPQLLALRSRTPSSDTTTQWITDIHQVADNFASFNLILGNHILDDLLLHTWSPRKYHDCYGNPKKTGGLWRDLGESRLRQRTVDEVASCIGRIADSAAGGSRLILNEYPSSFSILHNIPRVNEIHRDACAAVLSRLSQCDGSVATFELESLPVPLICKLPGSFIVFRKSDPVLHA